MNPGSNYCEADALTTTSSRRTVMTNCFVGRATMQRLEEMLSRNEAGSGDSKYFGLLDYVPVPPKFTIVD